MVHNKGTANAIRIPAPREGFLGIWGLGVVTGEVAEWSKAPVC
jgi:hypothetical protein